MALALLAGCTAADPSGRAVAMSWPGAVGTFLDLDFLTADHTVFVRFAPRYPHGTTAAVLGENGGGALLFGLLDHDFGRTGTKIVLNVGEAFEFWELEVVPDAWISAALVARVDGTDVTYTVWLDGAPLEGELVVSTLDREFPEGTLRLGQRTTLAPGPVRQFYGLIDDVAVFTEALSDRKVAKYLDPSYVYRGGEPSLHATITFDDDPALPEADIEPAGTATLVDVPGFTEAADPAWVPPPITDLALQLPFQAGVPFRVEHGIADPTTHHTGTGAFALDFVVDGFPQGDTWPEGTAGAPILTAAAGVMLILDDRRATGQEPPNRVEIEQGDDSYARYLHLQRGTGAGIIGLETAQGVRIGNAGDVGAEAAGANQIHFEVASQPSGAENAVTYPVLFRDYEVRGTDGAWTSVDAGVPEAGQVVRRPPVR